MPRWVTVFGRVNHLDAEPGTQTYSAWAYLGWNEYPASAGGGINRHIAWYTNRYHVVSQCSLIPTHKNCLLLFRIEKLEWCGEKCLFVSTQYMNVTDGRTDTQTDTAWRHRPRLCSSRGKDQEKVQCADPVGSTGFFSLPCCDEVYFWRSFDVITFILTSHNRAPRDCGSASNR